MNLVDRNTDRLKFNLDTLQARHRKTIRTTAREIAKMIVNNGEYLDEIEVYRDIHPIPIEGGVLGHVVRAMEVTIRFRYGKRRVSQKSNQSDKDKKRP